MVLTNFECWAHGEVDAVNFETVPAARNSSVMDPFNARVVSHIASASNGYYGYSIVNNSEAAAAPDNNNNSCNNNNMEAMYVQSSDADSANAAAAARCKKRCFVMAEEQLNMEMDNLKAVKRCRFDDADQVAQYCNDFFSLPATQMIGTQACLMDYDYDMQPQHQQQLQEHMQQQQQQQQQQPAHPRLHQHYQDGQQQERSKALESINVLQLDDKCESKLSAEAADLYIATHGGCLHHFRPRCGFEADEEFDI